MKNPYFVLHYLFNFMMKRLNLFIFSPITLFMAILFCSIDPVSAEEPEGLLAKISQSLGGSFDVKQKQSLPFEAGEEFVYTVYYKGISIGESSLTFCGEREINDTKAYYITFNTYTLYLNDEEELYAQKETFLPLRVERTIKKTVGFTEKIKESYNQPENRVTIYKKGFLSSSEQTIDKDSDIHNAILLSYYIRSLKELEKMQRFPVNLPTRKFTMDYKGKETIKVRGKEHQALLFEGDPYRLKIWLKDDKIRTPLKIEYPKFFGATLVLKTVNKVKKDYTGG